MQKINFKDAIVIIKNGLKKAILTLHRLPNHKPPTWYKKSFIDAFNSMCANQNIKLKPVVKNIDIDFMDKVLYEWLSPLKKDEKYIAIGYASGIQRKIMAMKLGVSRQHLHKKYSETLEKILFHITKQSLC